VIVARRIQEAFATPIPSVDAEHPLSPIAASIGIAYPTAGDTAGALMRNAELAMYRSKEAGRGRVTVFEPGMHEALVERLNIEAELQHATERGEIRVVYQSIVDMRTGSLAGVEALARWARPHQATPPSAAFIPIAEETGLIGELGRWVLQAACRQGRAWLDEFPENPSLVMSVNLSGRQLAQPRLVEEVAGALAESGFPAEQLVLEITESVLMHDTATTIETLQAIKDLGVRLAIDDFGTGYSSLTYLQRFPIDVLKIDKSFIDGLGGGNAEETAVTRTIVSLAKTLRLETVAEGVERSEHVRELQVLDCDIAQGYFFARPLDAATLTALMAQPDTPNAALGPLAEPSSALAHR
jgi:EAL domain-containing protein (putative c-di-GMP-specific phosphodiesterase class I)